MNIQKKDALGHLRSLLRDRPNDLDNHHETTSGVFAIHALPKGRNQPMGDVVGSIMSKDDFFAFWERYTEQCRKWGIRVDIVFRNIFGVDSHYYCRLPGDLSGYEPLLHWPMYDDDLYRIYDRLNKILEVIEEAIYEIETFRT